MGAVNIIGAGLGGLYLAICLAHKGIHSNLISNMPSERAQSVLAEGGINVAVGPDDSIESHIEDTLRGGANLEPRENVAQLVNNAKPIIEDLIALGVPFERDETGLKLRPFGGQSHNRTAYCKTATGKMIMTSLIDAARKYEAQGLIRRLPHHECVDALIRDDKIGCAIIKDLFTGRHYKLEGTLVLANGGLNGFFYGNTTGSSLNNAHLQAKLFSQGMEFRNLEFIQFHPTTIDIKSKRLLVSEAARGEGGRLFTFDANGHKDYFMERIYPGKGNLMTRDVISREEFEILRDGGQIFLDMTAVEKSKWKATLSELRKEIMEYTGLDPAKEHIPVSPGIHYFMGGVAVDIHHHTNIKGIYAIGEAASIYHGANRLGGNSMLGALVGGKVASESIAEQGALPSSIEEIEYEEKPINARNRSQIRDILRQSMGIVRDGASLEKAMLELDGISNEGDVHYESFAKAFLASALARKESRGAHYRSDFPKPSEESQKQTIVKYGGEIKVGLK